MSRVQAVGRFRIHEGKAEEFKRLSAECMRLAREKDPGTIRYDVFLSADERQAVVYEEYASSEAHVTHFENMGENAQAIFDIVDQEGEFWGDPSPELREGLETYGVKIFKPFLRLEG